MRLNWLSNKGSLAPYTYLLLHIFLITTLIFTCPSFIDINNSKFLIFFWLDVVITVVMYFVVHRMDPGYVPFDGIFFTDQEEPPFSANNNHKYDSMMKLKAADSRIMYPGCDFSPSSMNNQVKQSGFTAAKSPKDKSQFLKITLGSTNASKNMKDTTINSPMQKTTKNEGNKLEEEDPRQGAGENQEEDEDNTRVEVCFSQEDVTERHDDIEDSPENNIEKDEKLDYPAQEASCEIQIEEIPEIKRGNSIGKDGNKYQEKTKNVGYLDKYKVKYGVQLDDVEEDPNEVNTNTEKTKGKSDPKGLIAFKQYISGQKSPKPVYSEQPPQFQSHGDENNKSRGLTISHEGDNSSLEQRKTNENTGSEKKPDTTQPPNDTSMSGHIGDADISICEQNVSIKINLGEDNSKIESKIMDKRPEKNTRETREAAKGQTPESLYVERRYCTACNLDQPLRSKHCRDCNRCIAQYDHHCPWIGTCIGEKNHLTFYFFLIFQLIEVVWGEIKLIEDVIERSNQGEWLSIDIWRLVALVLATFFMMMVGSLFVFHSYIATRNFTTWEVLSWGKISYLKEWQKGWGSPFSNGMKKNLEFFFSRKKELRRWKMPKYKAPLHEQNVEIK